MRHFLFMVGVAAVLAPLAQAQSSPASNLNCSTNTTGGPATSGGASIPANGHIAWPVGNPVWEFDFYRPANRTTGDGTGLELRNLHYKGRKVFERASVPILNVEYDPGAGCSCYRDWQYSEVGIDAPRSAGSPNPSGGCYAESAPGTVVTNCAANIGTPSNPIYVPGGDGAPGPVPDRGTFRGVAVEDYGTELVLTANMSAGWYRYRMKWHFYDDGRIWPEYSFAAASNSCTSAARRHHAYWRFDFDLENTPSNDIVTETSMTGEATTFTTEARRTWGTVQNRTVQEWSVIDATTGAGFRVVPSEADLETAVDAFSKADALVLRYKMDEIDDNASSCAFRFEPWLNGESLVGFDTVFWYRSSTTRPVGQSLCEIAGPTLRPVGYNPVATEGTAETLAPVEVQAATPNPYTSQTSVRFRLAEAQAVRVVLYDALGRQVRVLLDQPVEAGVYETVEIQAGDLPAGTYVVRVEGARASGSTRIVLAR